MRNIT
jgi:hypothetical protein